MIKKLILILLICSSAFGAAQYSTIYMADGIDTAFYTLWNRRQGGIYDTAVHTHWTTGIPGAKLLTGLNDTSNWRVEVLAHWTGSSDGEYYLYYGGNYDYMNEKTGYKLAPDGLNADTSWCRADTLFKKWEDSIDATVSSGGSIAAISDADMKAIIDTLFNRHVSDTLTSTLISLLARGGGGMGTGAYTYTVVLIDTSGTDSLIAQAPVFINNITQTMAFPYKLNTNNNGAAGFKLDAAIWTVLINKGGYACIFDTITTTGAHTDTFFTYNSAGNRTVLYGNIMSPTGQQAAYAVLEFQLKSVPAESLLMFGDTIITQLTFKDTADATGQFAIELYSNDTISDSSFYTVKAWTRQGKPLDQYYWNFHLSDSSSQISFVNCKRWR